MTTTELNQRQTAPPAPTAKQVRAHRQSLMMSIAAMRAGAPELAFASAMGNLGAKDALANLYLKLKTLEWELELNAEAVNLGRSADQAAETARREAIQALPAEEIIEGITRDSCCRLCIPGSDCVISAPAGRSGGICVHPVTQKHLFFLDETGRRHYPYEDNPRSYEIHLAACRKLKLKVSS
jgi:hypothetical protein